MCTSSNKGFSLIEVTSVVVIISFLLALGVLKIGETRNQSITLDNQNTLDAVQRLEQLAVAEALTITNTDATARINELQTTLASRGHTLMTLNPTNASFILRFDGTNWVLFP